MSELSCLGADTLMHNSAHETQTNHTQLGGAGNTQYNAQSQTFNYAAPIVSHKREIAACQNALLGLAARPEEDRAALISTKGNKVAGTCEWIKSNAEYMSLLRGDIPLLWICGGPGKGKTMLSISITQDLEKGTQVIYYFCAADVEMRRSDIYILRSLLWQLVTKQPELTDIVHQYVDTPEKTRSALESRETLWGMLVKIALDNRSHTTTCVIDGLDECDEQSQQWLAQKLINLSSVLDEDSSSHKWRVILITRPSISTLRASKRINLDPDNDEQVNQDVETFITAESLGLSKALCLSEDLRMKTESILLDRAESTFLWVGFAMRELRQKKTWTEAEQTLNSLPKGLPALYDRMLQQIESVHRPTSSIILRWVAMAVRPLSLTELGAVLSNRPEPTTEQLVRDQVTLCGSFVIFTNGLVKLVHESARDYLLRKKADFPSSDCFRIHAPDAHLQISRTCLAAIERNPDYLKSCSTGMNRKLSLSPPPGEALLQYAIVYWHEHARHASEDFEQLIKHSPVFFAETSLLRDHWCSAFFFLRSPGHYILDRHLRNIPMLHLACYLGIAPWVRICLEDHRLTSLWQSPGQRSNPKSASGAFPLHYAIWEGHFEVAKILLEKEADIDAKDDLRHMTALSYAITLDIEAAVPFLLDNGADVNTVIPRREGLYWKALHAAVDYHDYQLARLLLNKGANLEVKDDYGFTPLHYAVKINDEGMIRLLLDHGANVHTVSEHCECPIHLAASKGDVATMLHLLSHGADVKAASGFGLEPLHRAAQSGVGEAIRLLINNGANVDAESRIRETPLHLATGKSELEAISVLLDFGASINARDLNGRTPLHHAAAARVQSENVVRALIGRGARIHTKDSYGNTPLRLAIQFDNQEIIPLLTPP